MIKLNDQKKITKIHLKEITDLCGIRIITYYTEEINKIQTLENELK
jgi:ppGpp synthetase/RelA/SpoT-type nucleotidyltranferase